MATTGLDVTRLAKRAAQDVGDIAPDLVGGYIAMLDAVSATGRRLIRTELDSLRRLGAGAAEDGVPLRALVDLYLSANWVVWRQLPAVAAAADRDRMQTIAEVVLHAADDAVVALAEGYDRAQRLILRQEEAVRREFIDDLLHGRGDLGERAERYGLRLTGRHVVAAARAETRFTDGDSTTRRVESALLDRFDAREVLITTKDGLLVCITFGANAGAPAEFARQVGLLPLGRSVQVGVGRPFPGAGGVLRSYEEARGTLELATRLDLTAPVLSAADLLAFQVLFRDRTAITDLVATVLAPLERTRGGATPLLDTLSAYFATGQVTAETARRLFLSVRTVTYRLDRIRHLTGHDPREPTQRFTLEAAALGARLLGWPTHPLTPQT
ncbi:MAG TPA: helix-turn-helix domain-containing protein [Actinophytocola sp.]|uniref:PucR family transcriptional regulator n=1 Tax=Actinophytocola sp. TaxID=1872138 RepID=UPI002DBAE87B|nr:helix-turn-helix domain-containing protein [Actinophytocola sp.]HEU5470250.1 helix-turn-helix domain-containing protein [Actinophytocola sp.]